MDINQYWENKSFVVGLTGHSITLESKAEQKVGQIWMNYEHIQFADGVSIT